MEYNSGGKNELTIGTYKKGIYYELKKNSLKKLHMYNSIYMEFCKSKNYRNGEQINVCWGKCEGRLWLQRCSTREFFQVIELFSILIVLKLSIHIFYM